MADAICDRLRPAGSIVRTVSSPDGTHPTHGCNRTPWPTPWSP